MNQKHKRTVRIEKLPPYLFGKLNDLKLKMRQDGMDLIDFGMGNPNIPTSEHIVNKLNEVVKDPKTHRYSSCRGIPNLRKAICRKYKALFDVDIKWETESIALLGSKEGLLSGRRLKTKMVSSVENPFMKQKPTWRILLVLASLLVFSLAFSCAWDDASSTHSTNSGSS